MSTFTGDDTILTTRSSSDITGVRINPRPSAATDTAADTTLFMDDFRSVIGEVMSETGTTAEYGAAVDDGVAVTSGANKSTLPSSAIIATHAATHYELRMKATIFSHWKLHNTCGQKMNRS